MTAKSSISGPCPPPFGRLVPVQTRFAKVSAKCWADETDDDLSLAAPCFSNCGTEASKDAAATPTPKESADKSKSVGSPHVGRPKHAAQAQMPSTRRGFQRSTEKSQPGDKTEAPKEEKAPKAVAPPTAPHTELSSSPACVQVPRTWGQQEGLNKDLAAHWLPSGPVNTAANVPMAPNQPANPPMALSQPQLQPMRQPMPLSQLQANLCTGPNQLQAMPFHQPQTLPMNQFQGNAPMPLNQLQGNSAMPLEQNNQDLAELAWLLTSNLSLASAPAPVRNEQFLHDLVSAVQRLCTAPQPAGCNGTLSTDATFGMGQQPQMTQSAYQADGSSLAAQALSMAQLGSAQYLRADNSMGLAPSQQLPAHRYTANQTVQTMMMQPSMVQGMCMQQATSCPGMVPAATSLQPQGARFDLPMDNSLAGMQCPQPVLGAANAQFHRMPASDHVASEGLAQDLGRKKRKGPAYFARCLATVEGLDDPCRAIKVSHVSRFGPQAIKVVRHYFEEQFGQVENILEVFPDGEKASEIIFVIMASRRDADRALAHGSHHLVRPKKSIKVQQFSER